MKKEVKIVLWVLFALFFSPLALIVFLVLHFSKNEKDAPAKKEKVAPGFRLTTEEGVIYAVQGVRGRFLRVFDDKCIITVKPGLGSLLTHNATDGEKTIYFVDCVGVQFKQAGYTIGYLQLETAASSGNNKNSNFFAENSFTFDINTISNEDMQTVADFIKKKIDQLKKQQNASVINPLSSADELKKYKELFDAGVLTQEEFEEKKKELLHL